MKQLNLNIEQSMIELGHYLSKKSASKAEVSKKTGVSKYIISELTLNISTYLRTLQLYLISIDVVLGKVVEVIYNEVKLKN